jgi:carbon storage regulator
MLVLRRKVGESLTIAKDITITVLAVEGDRVKIGIEAPSHIDIVRSELLEMEGTRENLRINSYEH